MDNWCGVNNKLKEKVGGGGGEDMKAKIKEQRKAYEKEHASNTVESPQL